MQNWSSFTLSLIWAGVYIYGHPVTLSFAVNANVLLRCVRRTRWWGGNYIRGGGENGAGWWISCWVASGGPQP